MLAVMVLALVAIVIYRFVLTDQPVIVDNKNQISAPKITIYRTNQTMVTEGKPCKVVIINGGIGSGTPAPDTDNK